jgi:hypothetical protein
MKDNKQLRDELTLKIKIAQPQCQLVRMTQTRLLNLELGISWKSMLMKIKHKLISTRMREPLTIESRSRTGM